MRLAWLALLVCSLSFAQESARYGVPAAADKYPQTSSRAALTSVLAAIDANDPAYLVAHLADPTFIDARVQRVFAGKFAEQVQDTRARLDPSTVKLLRRFLKEGKWTEAKDTATVKLDDVPGRVVRLVKRENRWFLAHNWSTEN